MLNRYLCRALLAGMVLFAATGALAQVSSINSAVVQPRAFNDDPTSILTVVNNYPSLISFDDQSVDNNGAGGFANRHLWNFSNNGTTAYRFANNDYIEVFMDVTLSADPIVPRKEAGFLFDTIGGQGQFIVTSNRFGPQTTPGEVVAFGGPLPFHAFAPTFDVGETIRLGITYFQDTDGLRKIIYHADGQSSPALAFGNLEQGIINNTTLGGYLQVGIDPTNPANFGTATFANISIAGVPAVVPEPTSLLTLALGIAVPASLLRRRRR